MSDKICAIISCNNANPEKLIKCSGLCTNSVHAACIKVTSTMFPLFNSNTNFKWFCDECKVIFSKLTQNTEGIWNILKALADDVKVLSDDLKVITRVKTSENDSIEKRSTRSAKKNLAVTDNQPSTPVPSMPVKQLSQHHQNDYIIGTCSDENVEIKSVPERKYIYASRFSNSTTDVILKTFLSTKLGLSQDDIDCRLLVSANQDVSRLNFISFKVGVDPSLFNKLLKPDLWPAGVLVREFVRRSKNFVPVVLD